MTKIVRYKFVIKMFSVRKLGKVIIYIIMCHYSIFELVVTNSNSIFTS